jgi:hypothetical protein
MFGGIIECLPVIYLSTQLTMYVFSFIDRKKLEKVIYDIFI